MGTKLWILKKANVPTLQMNIDRHRIVLLLESIN
uniref:Uncharacterized protein n=1 Tax=Rhizophora mucronata TaxID=61149 RepID=A0A2P2JBP3_RHIMU